MIVSENELQDRKIWKFLINEISLGWLIVVIIDSVLLVVLIKMFIRYTSRVDNDIPNG